MSVELVYRDPPLRDLVPFIEGIIEATVRAVMKETDPEGDLISQSKAERFLQQKGIRKVMLKRWVDAGYIMKRKTSEQQSATCLYSVTELKTFIAALKLKTAYDELPARCSKASRGS